MEINNIYHGDCRKILSKEIKHNSIQTVFADPPYNLSGNNLKWEGNKTGGDWYMINEDWDKMGDSDYRLFTYEWIEKINAVLKNNGSIFISCTYHNIGEIILTLKKLDFKINNIITWYKTNAMPNMTKRTFTHACEYIIWAVKGKNWIFNYEKMKTINPKKTKQGKPKQMRDMWEMPLCQGKERIKGEDGRAAHPTQKPEELLKRVILASSNKGDIVLDPFFGTGTTGYIADKYNRKWIGIEIEKEYIKIAKERIYHKGE